MTKYKPIDDGKKQFVQLKNTVLWNVGAAISFMLYYTGVIPLYIYIRKKWFRSFIIVILMYHRVDHEQSSITVSCKNFNNQMRYLRNNFNVISLKNILSTLEENAPLDDDTVAVTFDDGWKDNFINAYPILSMYKMPATIFVTSKFIDRENGLSRDEIKEMHKNHITIGAHTITHPILSHLDQYSAEEEIVGSKKKLEEILQEQISFFAYPYGKKGVDFNDETIDLVKKNNYSAAVSTNNGLLSNKSNLFALERIGMRNYPMFFYKTRLSGLFESKLFYIFRRMIGV